MAVSKLEMIVSLTKKTACVPDLTATIANKTATVTEKTAAMATNTATIAKNTATIGRVCKILKSCDLNSLRKYRYDGINYYFRPINKYLRPQDDRYDNARGY